MNTMKKLEKILKVFANARRLAILAHLCARKEATVGNVSREIKLSFKSTSRHLAVLFSADLVEREQRNLEVYYSVSKSGRTMFNQVFSIL